MEYEVRYQPADRLLRIEGSGFWGDEEALGYHAAVVDGLAQAARRGEFAVLIDISRLEILPQSVVATVARTAALIDVSPATRVALVSSKAIGRMQSERISSRRDNFRIFERLPEAIGWLSASSVGP